MTDRDSSADVHRESYDSLLSKEAYQAVICLGEDIEKEVEVCVQDCHKSVLCMRVYRSLIKTTWEFKWVELWDPWDVCNLRDETEELLREHMLLDQELEVVISHHLLKFGRSKWLEIVETNFER